MAASALAASEKGGLIERKSASAQQLQARCQRQIAVNRLHFRSRETTAPPELSTRPRSRCARSGHVQSRKPDDPVPEKGRRSTATLGTRGRRGLDGPARLQGGAGDGLRRFTSSKPAARRQVRGRKFRVCRSRRCGPGTPFTQQLANEDHRLAPCLAHQSDPPFWPFGATTAASRLPPAAARRQPPSRPFSSPISVRRPPR